MLVDIIQFLVKLNDKLFFAADSLLERLPLPDWAIDAVIDSMHMLPFLVVIFFVIEFIEYYYSDKMESLAKYSGKAGPFAGSLLASFPQCGFSVIASTLYSKRLITKGTLIAVFLSTSDEAIPVLLSDPAYLYLVVPVVAAKICIAITAGYFIDFIIDCKHKYTEKSDSHSINDDCGEDTGCCHHHVTGHSKSDLFVHPLKHSANIFIFILFVTLVINYYIMLTGGEENLGRLFLGDSVFQPVVTAIVGLIPNCAISIAITLMYVKGAISFGSAIAGLCSSAGLGLLVLVKRNTSAKDTVKIILILLAISIFAGIAIQAAGISPLHLNYSV